MVNRPTNDDDEELSLGNRDGGSSRYRSRSSRSLLDDYEDDRQPKKTESINDIAEENPETVADTWKNRRRMAWIALISMILFTIYLFTFAPMEKLKPLGDVITWYYMTMSTIVCAYMGLATYAYVRKK